FFTADTQFKSSRGGKGLGRFVWLKAFDRAEIESHFLERGALRMRSFVFDLNSDEPEHKSLPSSALKPSTTVKLLGMRKEYQDQCPKSLEIIGHRVAEHCLPFFLDPNCPSVTISDEQDSIDLNAYFSDTFREGAVEHVFKVKDVSFRMKGLRLYHPL